MFEEPSLAETVGLKHVIEDGLAILAGHPLNDKRREFVIRDLRDLLHQAIRGSHIASQSTLFLGESDREAFGSFTLIDRYLGGVIAPGWVQQAPNALKVVEQLQQATVPDEAEKQAAREIFEALLSQISTDPVSEVDVRDFATANR